jgi:molecular chaperone DnaK (HSP70)
VAGTTIGFDFGTSTTLLASSDGVVPIGRQLKWLPSLAGYREDGSIVIGEDAVDPPAHQVIRSIKRMITDQRDYVRVDLPSGPRDVRADDLMVELVREVVRRGETNDQPLTRRGAVRLGCPAMWDGPQRRRLVGIAQRAGVPITLANLVDEPVAAGITWLAGSRSAGARPVRMVVFDMGGGTLDIAVLDVRGTDHQDVSVLAAFGVPEAGDALDLRIAGDLDLALGAGGFDIDALPRPRRARELVLDAARGAKIGLTDATEYPVVLPPSRFGVHEIWYTREQLNDAFAEQMDRAESAVLLALQIARLAEPTAGPVSAIVRTPVETLVNSVDVVVLSGGMSRIPYVAECLRRLFPSTTRVELAAPEPENAVVLGLAQAPRYGRINMYRPAFDIRLDWDRGREQRVIYQAFSPLVEARQIAGGDGELRFVRTAADLKVPRKAKGRLRVTSYTGDRVRATLGGHPLDGHPVRLTEDEFEFAIYPSGRLRLVDGNGEHEGHLTDWQALST